MKLNQTSIEDLEDISREGGEYIYMSDPTPTQQDMYTLYNYLHNTEFDYDDIDESIKGLGLE